jgi:hypothetical protein
LGGYDFKTLMKILEKRKLDSWAYTANKDAPIDFPWYTL